MCGIVGYVGEDLATPILINGLKKLEYRGYDSAGIAIFDNEKKKIGVIKSKGRLSNLEEKVNSKQLNSTIGIGHTRWATHGEPSDVNSHPHMSNSGKIAVVHNGIIENYAKLKEQLTQKGYKFVSETDTEVIAQLIDFYYEGDLVEALSKTVKELKGSYAIGVVCQDNVNEFIATRKDSPLIVGVGENGMFIASDIPAILEYTRNVYLLEDGEIAVLTKENVQILNKEKQTINKELLEVKWDVTAAEKSGYEHFMLKEICEQPKVIKDTISPRIQDNNVVLDKIKITKEQLQNIDKIYIVACGTSYHAGMIGKYVIEKLTRIPVEIDVASEFRYRNPIVNERTLMFIISQSGETADTLAALREAKKNGARVVSIVNVIGSSIARESDDVLYTLAGPEIAVASTKAYTTQVSALYLLALDMGTKLGTINQQHKEEILSELKNLPDKIETILKNKENIKRLASNYYEEHNVFYIGRGLDYAVAQEASLKLKEISYIHSEAYSAGELKHGTIALIEKNTLVVAIATQQNLFEKTLSNVKEVKARGAVVMAIAQEGESEIKNECDLTVYIPKTHEILTPLLSIIPLQLFAYYVAVLKGCDVDKPRNLAKSVTVE